MAHPLFQVDAFASAAFAGNPAAVCILAEPQTEAWMQNVASEMNLSETAFLRARPDGSYDLRWFTPEKEVDLCGHATLASAHVLWSEGYLASDATARFETRSGQLTTERNDGWIHMDFPADSLTPTDAPGNLIEGLRTHAPEAMIRTDRDYLVCLETAAQVRSLDPDLEAFARIGEGRGVLVTAEAEEDDIDFVSRYFAPSYGIPEDPVTGSTHCALGPYWAHQLGKTSLVARQVSDRGGTVQVQLDSPDAERVTVGGQAATVLRGRLQSSSPTSPGGV